MVLASAFLPAAVQENSACRGKPASPPHQHLVLENRLVSGGSVSPWTLSEVSPAVLEHRSDGGTCPGTQSSPVVHLSMVQGAPERAPGLPCSPRCTAHALEATDRACFEGPWLKEASTEEGPHLSAFLDKMWRPKGA